MSPVDYGSGPAAVRAQSDHKTTAFEALEPRLLLSAGAEPTTSLATAQPGSMVAASSADAEPRDLGGLIGPGLPPDRTGAIQPMGSASASPGGVTVPHYDTVPDYSYWYGCSPTAGGMHAAWWDQQVRQWDAAYTAFAGDPANWRYCCSTDPATYVVPDYANGVVAGWNHRQDGSSWFGHLPDSIADFMLTRQNGSYADDIAWGMEQFMAWDDPRTPENESWTAAVRRDPSLSWQEYKTEIDAGRPVHLTLDSWDAGGHSVLGVGYNEGPGGDEQWVKLYTTWNDGLREWEFRGETETGRSYSVDEGIMMEVLPRAGGLRGYFAVHHSYIHDLTVRIGLGDPADPVWARTVRQRSGGDRVNLVMTDVDLEDARPHLAQTAD